MIPLFLTLALFATLWWVSRKLATFFVSSAYLLTQDDDVVSSLYAIFILPGTAVHELSHWLMAKFVGVRTKGITLLPKLSKSGKLQLGSVNVSGGVLWQHTLIGLAPLVVGALLTVLLSYRLVDVARLESAWQLQHWDSLLDVFAAALSQPNALIWLYLLFTVSDAMFLSRSDLEPAQRMLVYVAAGVVLLVILGVFPALGGWANDFGGVFRVLAFGLAIALLAHAGLMIVFAGVFYGLRTVLGR